MNRESLKSNTPPSLQSYCLPVEVSLKEPQFFTKDLPQCSQRSGTSPTAQLLAGSDVPSPSVCYGLRYNVYAVHVRRRERLLDQYPVDVVAAESNLTPCWETHNYYTYLPCPSLHGSVKYTRLIVHRPQNAQMHKKTKQTDVVPEFPDLADYCWCFFLLRDCPL